MVSRETSEHSSVEELVVDALAVSGLAAGDFDATRLAKHLEMVLLENERTNLTSINEAEQAVWLHVIDSLLLREKVDIRAGSTLVDIGSGGGYPGVPLALRGDLAVTLLESRRKRADFLSEAIDTLGVPNAEIRCVRAEEFALSDPASQDYVVARAVSELAALVELASPILRDGGRLLAMKGAPDAQEVERGDAAAAQCGMRREAIVEYALPGPRNERRAIVVFVKAGEPLVDLPRRAGRAQKSPLVR